jgi:hypothetical protein
VDLRRYIKTRDQLNEGIELARNSLLLYQPFILADDVEVGEGQNLQDRYQNAKSIFDFNVYAPNYDLNRGAAPKDLLHFRRCNEEYRQLYTHIVNEICDHVDGPITNYTVAEIGCNTGLNLFNLALRGAKSCRGYDWNDMTPVFRWLNELLGTDVEFAQGVYDNLHHRFEGDVEVEEVDIMVNTVFTNHQCDPLQFLCYLCDRTRHAVFLWALIHTDHPDACIIYPTTPPHEILSNDRAFPLNLNNGILMSERLLDLSFRCLGFEVQKLPEYCPSEQWKEFTTGFRMFYAKRTRDVKSAYWTER